MENQVLTPHVYWAQRHRELYLRVELSDVQNPAISITENVLHFKAQGHGAKGDNVYEFHLEFLDLVKPEPVYKLTQRQVNITVQKKVSQWWERLTKQEKRPLFLAPDFDRWLDESDAEMELRAKEEERLNKLRLESQGSPETLISLKKGYLFMYNLVQFLGFSWIFVNMTVRFFILGKESFYDTFHTVADMMYFCQMLAAVESINAAIGVTKTPVIPSLSQLLGRNFILFIVFGTVEEMQSKAVVFFVFYIWSTVEIFRYPFYMLSCIDMDWKVLTWLRYTVWIPLYPMGCLAEAVSVIQSIPIFNETGRFSFTLPYPVKIKVRFSFFLQIYLILLFLVADSLSRGIVTEVVTQLAARKKARKASVQAAARHQKAFCLTIGKPPILHKGYYPFQKDFKPKMLQSLVLEERLYVNFRHLYKQRRRRFGQKKKKIH